MIKARAKSERAAARASSLNNPMTAAYLSGDIATPSVEEQTTEAGPSQSHDEAESQPGNSSAAASAVDLHAPVEEPNTNGDGSATNADSSAPAPNPEESAPAPPPPTRLELLKAKPYLVQRFVRHILPILIDVYAASVALTVRSRCLMGLLKAVSFVEADDLKFILKVCHLCLEFILPTLMRVWEFSRYLWLVSSGRFYRLKIIPTWSSERYNSWNCC